MLTDFSNQSNRPVVIKSFGAGVRYNRRSSTKFRRVGSQPYLSRVLATVCSAPNVNIHVRSELVLHGKRSAADVAQVRALFLVHGPRVSLQHVPQQESLAALRALESTVAAMRQNVPLQLAAPGELLGADVAYVLLLTGMKDHVIGQLGSRLADPRAHRAYETRARGLHLATGTAGVRSVGLVN